MKQSNQALFSIFELEEAELESMSDPVIPLSITMYSWQFILPTKMVPDHTQCL